MSNKLVSIIVPVYNTSSFLEKCVSSLLNQSYKEIE
ncbi:MAG: glycosyltransferase, partial [Bacteroidales bacterium]|nr:glycosyltransferase [Bacteroidales bacterium]